MFIEMLNYFFASQGHFLLLGGGVEVALHFLLEGHFCWGGLFVEGGIWGGGLQKLKKKNTHSLQMHRK